MESLSTYLGRYLDVHRHDRNFHFAVPSIHSISPDDRDVGSQDGRAGGGSALWGVAGNRIGLSGRKGAHAMITTPYGHKVYAMAAEYPSAAALYEAAKRVRDSGFRRCDVDSPFPIHGMDDAMGLGKSWLSGWDLYGGLSGFLTAVAVGIWPFSLFFI